MGFRIWGVKVCVGFGIRVQAFGDFEVKSCELPHGLMALHDVGEDLEAQGVGRQLFLLESNLTPFTQQS